MHDPNESIEILDTSGSSNRIDYEGPYELDQEALAAEMEKILSACRDAGSALQSKAEMLPPGN